MSEKPTIAELESHTATEASVITDALRPWKLDPVHSEIEFAARHLMIANVKGRFADPEGSVQFDPANPSTLDLEIRVPVATIDTRNPQRDTHLRSPDFFDADNFPFMIFHGTHVDGEVSGHFKLTGELTIRGTTKPIVLDVTAEGEGDDPWGNERLGFSATGAVNRQEFGLRWNQTIETGGVVVGDTIKIIVNAEFMRAHSR